MVTEKFNKSNIENLIHYVRSTPMFRQLVPMEAITGWPIPFKRGGEVFIKLPFYGVQNKERGCTLIYPMLAIITVQFPSKEIVEYRNIRYSNQIPREEWEEPVGKFPHEAISSMTVGQYRHEKKMIMMLYDKIIECLENNKELNIEDYNQFSDNLSKLIEPGLRPFYNSNAPEFYKNFIREQNT